MDDSFASFLLFLKDYPPIHYKKGETLLRPKDAPPGVFVLKKGYVKLYALSEEGEELTLIIYQPGDFFPMYLVFTDLSGKYYFEAHTSVEVHRVSKADFLRFVKKNPDVLIKIAGKMVVRLGGLLERMEYLVFGSAKKRVASILLILGERFGKEVGNTIEIACPFTHKDIANLVGITRETTSGIMSSFLKKGYITYKGKVIVIKNRSGLLKESLVED